MDGGPTIKIDINLESTGSQEDNNVEEIKPNLNESFPSQDMIKHEPEFIVGPDENSDLPSGLAITEDLNDEHQEPDQMPCLICSESFLSSEELSLHSAQHTKSEMKKDPSKEQINKQSSKTIGTVLTLQKLLQIHVNIAVDLDGETTYTCKLCPNKVFSQLVSIRNHMKIHGNCKYKERSCHRKETPHICSTCNKTFSDADQLGKHIKIHTDTSQLSSSTDLQPDKDDKPFKCEKCTFATTQSAYLRRHMRTHTGERPFKCSYCDKAFAEKKRLASHTRNHTGEKPYKCEYCSASYGRSDNFKYHMLTHTGERPFECDECRKCFMEPRALVSHKKIHTDEKPFSCPHCEMNFRHNGTLVNHLLTHTNERPFKCDLCEKGFRRKELLKRHFCKDSLIYKDVLGAE